MMYENEARNFLMDAMEAQSAADFFAEAEEASQAAAFYYISLIEDVFQHQAA